MLIPIKNQMDNNNIAIVELEERMKELEIKFEANKQASEMKKTSVDLEFMQAFESKLMSEIKESQTNMSLKMNQEIDQI